MGSHSLAYLFFLGFAACQLRSFARPAPVLLAFSLVYCASFGWEHLAPPLVLSASAWLLAPLVVPGKQFRRVVFAASLALNFLPLLAWKLGLSPPRDDGFFFPIGLSFYSFHCASYLVDCYRGHFRPEGRASRLFLYVTFFPQLVAGPITRPAEFFPQLSSWHMPEARERRRAMERIFLGLFKKLAIADALGPAVLRIFGAPDGYHAVAVAGAAFAGRYFIYADFSGYSDIAIGSARLLGITLPENFDRPFAATSIADYWRRWHMTLSRWIRDYFFFPMVGSPLSALGPHGLVLLTFLCFGLWHRFSWNFALYGLWHGALLVAYGSTSRLRARLAFLVPLPARARAVLSAAFTFACVVSPPTVFFLTPDLGAAASVVSGLLNEKGLFLPVGMPGYRTVTCVLSIALLEGWQWLSARLNPGDWLDGRPLVARWGVYCLAFLLLALCADVRMKTDFMYVGF